MTTAHPNTEVSEGVLRSLIEGAGGSNIEVTFNDEGTVIEAVSIISEEGHELRVLVGSDISVAVADAVETLLDPGEEMNAVRWPPLPPSEIRLRSTDVVGTPCTCRPGADGDRRSGAACFRHPDPANPYGPAFRMECDRGELLAWAATQDEFSQSWIASTLEREDQRRVANRRPGR